MLRNRVSIEMPCQQVVHQGTPPDLDISNARHRLECAIFYQWLRRCTSFRSGVCPGNQVAGMRSDKSDDPPALL